MIAIASPPQAGGAPPTFPNGVPPEDNSDDGIIGTVKNIATKIMKLQAFSWKSDSFPPVPYFTGGCGEAAGTRTQRTGARPECSVFKVGVVLIPQLLCFIT